MTYMPKKIVCHLEEGPYCSPTMWKRLANCFNAELIMIGHHHPRDLRFVIREHEQYSWTRLTPHGQISLEDFQHDEHGRVDGMIYYVGPDAQPCPPIPGAYDVTIPVGSQELHAITAMTIALWDRRMKLGF